MSEHSPSLIDRFERAFVLSTSRALFLCIAVLAALALFGGGLAFAYSITPTLRGADPAEPAVPSVPEVSLADVLAVLDAPEVEYDGEEGEGGGNSFVDAELSGAADAHPGSAESFAALASRLGSFFDQSRYPWLSETQLVCTYRSYYRGCANWENRTVRKGVVEIANESLKGMDSTEQIALLKAIIDVMPLCVDEDTRFVAVGTVIDVAAAAGAVNGDAMAALEAMLLLPTPAGSADPKPVLAANIAQDYMKGVLKARKRGAAPGLVVAWIRAIPELYALFGNDATGQPNRVEGLGASWQALQGTLPELAATRIAGIQGIARAAPEPRRPEIVRAYGDLVRGRAAEAQRTYESALAERRMEMVKLDVAVVEGQEAKSTLRAGATSVVGSAFVLIAGVGLLLALLAVERNTRALREVLVRLEAPRPPSAP